MPELRRCRKGISRTAVVRSAEALDDLRFIRQTMENSASFTAVPGWGMVVMGLTALVAAAIARRQPDLNRWMGVWVADAVLAFGIAVFTAQRKARRKGTLLSAAPGRRFALGFLPAVVAGAVLTPVLLRAGVPREVPGTWLVLYGTAVVSGGALSIGIVPIMGLGFIAMGLAAFLAPASWSNAAMAAGFGGLHIVFGVLIARRHGG